MDVVVKYFTILMLVCSVVYADDLSILNKLIQPEISESSIYRSDKYLGVLGLSQEDLIIWYMDFSSDTLKIGQPGSEHLFYPVRSIDGQTLILYCPTSKPILINTFLDKIERAVSMHKYTWTQR